MDSDYVPESWTSLLGLQLESDLNKVICNTEVGLTMHIKQNSAATFLACRTVKD